MRLFIGLEPPSEVRKALAVQTQWLHALLGGKRMFDSNLHLTLAFLGETSPQAVQRLRKLLAAAPNTPFTLKIDLAGDFNRGGVVWLGCGDMPPALAALSDAIRQGLADNGITFDSKPLAPHITVLRKSQSIRASLTQPIDWPVDKVVLYVSESTPAGVVYRPLFQEALTQT
ncbi:RNA 2',3'-cyclic phosphodiesterase [Andreprevotia chitinilytica]|uniref:RNA 2',3'-cyclic phosphodiesterase n=1 Tax=Andreprevotia chitinilytica TaxID=396808 RepID=UPI000690A289|nr:RNA 2',3'-cyclic phosphodiesterase [Andreprevotia chitinilytica]